MSTSVKAAELPGSSGGFTMGVWRAVDVPVGSEVGIVTSPTAASGAPPELPEILYLGGDEAYGDVVYGYTADHLRDYALAAVLAEREACAKLIEEGQETITANGPNGESNQRYVSPRKANNLMGIAYADAIRART